jgi:N6-L-threonylcarbamoyladenine synthase
MSTFKWRLYDIAKQDFGNVGMTFGYITKCNRIHHDLPKSHNVDAYCIACNFKAIRLDYMFKFRQLRKHNRQIHKFSILKGGKRKLNQTPYKVFGYRLFDKVSWNGQECFIGARRSSGSFKLVDIDNHLLKDGVLYKKLRLLEPKRTYIGSIVK